MTILSEHITERWQPPSFQPPPPQEMPDLDAMAANARQKGYSDGYQEGLSAAEQDAAQFARLAKQLTQPYADLASVVTPELAQLAASLARQVIQRELLLDSGIIEDCLKQALASLSQLEGPVFIHVHPADKVLVEAVAPQLLEDHQWRLVEDSELLPGGCTVKTPRSFIDASVEKRMSDLFEQVLSAAQDDNADQTIYDPAPE